MAERGEVSETVTEDVDLIMEIVLLAFTAGVILGVVCKALWRVLKLKIDRPGKENPITLERNTESETQLHFTHSLDGTKKLHIEWNPPKSPGLMPERPLKTGLVPT